MLVLIVELLNSAHRGRDRPRLVRAARPVQARQGPRQRRGAAVAARLRRRLGAPRCGSVRMRRMTSPVAALRLLRLAPRRRPGVLRSRARRSGRRIGAPRLAARLRRRPRRPDGRGRRRRARRRRRGGRRDPAVADGARGRPPGLTELHVVDDDARAQAADGRARRRLRRAARRHRHLRGAVRGAGRWRQLGYHDKPVGLLNVGGYYDALLAFLRPERSGQGFVDARAARLLHGRRATPTRCSTHRGTAPRAPRPRRLCAAI